jgi:ribosomal protein S18 acetylase RimI-like enzyme
VIRRLGWEDGALLAELCARFGKGRPDARILDDRTVHVFAALEDGEVVAFAYCHVLPRLDGTENVFLYELAVDERFRGRGIGRALVDEALRLAGRRRLFVLADEDDAAAQALYAAAGGEPQAQVLYRFDRA